MSRTIAEINTELRTNFVANETIKTLYGLSDGSTFEQEFSIVSLEAVLFYIIAVSIWVLERNFDELEQRVTDKVAQAKRWNLPALVQDAKAYQLGDPLVWVDGEYKYIVQEGANIITFAAAQEIGNSVVLKVATDFMAPGIQPLEDDHLLAFSEYIAAMKPPGVNLLIVSRPADMLKIYYRVYVNPLVFDLTGGLLTDPSLKPVETAIQQYCKGLDFNGRFSITELTDQLQAIPGVLAPVFVEGHAKYGSEGYTQFSDFYTPNAGYLEIDPDFPLATTITYLNLP